MSFADAETERFYTTGKTRRFPNDIRKRAAMRLTQIDAATRIDDLKLPPSNRLESLKRDRKGQWSIRINDQWRVCFRFDEPHSFDVEIVDYHYRSFMIKSGLPPFHPGELLSEILQELGISQASFSRSIGVTPMRVSHVVTGARPVTAELALLFGHAFGQSPQFWLNLQTKYDLRIAEKRMGKRLKAVPELRAF